MAFRQKNPTFSWDKSLHSIPPFHFSSLYHVFLKLQVLQAGSHNRHSTLGANQLLSWWYLSDVQRFGTEYNSIKFLWQRLRFLIGTCQASHSVARHSCEWRNAISREFIFTHYYPSMNCFTLIRWAKRSTWNQISSSRVKLGQDHSQSNLNRFVKTLKETKDWDA